MFVLSIELIAYIYLKSWIYDIVFIFFQVIITKMVVITPELNEENAISLSFCLNFK